MNTTVMYMYKSKYYYIINRVDMCMYNMYFKKSKEERKKEKRKRSNKNYFPPKTTQTVAKETQSAVWNKIHFFFSFFLFN